MVGCRTTKVDAPVLPTKINFACLVDNILTSIQKLPLLRSREHGKLTGRIGDAMSNKGHVTRATMVLHMHCWPAAGNTVTTASDTALRTVQDYTPHMLHQCLHAGSSSTGSWCDSSPSMRGGSDSKGRAGKPGREVRRCVSRGWRRRCRNGCRYRATSWQAAARRQPQRPGRR